jgi:hypothetical protein
MLRYGFCLDCHGLKAVVPSWSSWFRMVSLGYCTDCSFALVAARERHPSRRGRAWDGPNN